MKFRLFQNNDLRIIYDAKLIEPSEELFNKDKLLSRSNGCAAGRGTAIMFAHEGRELVFKRYRRGGLIGRLVKETYLYRNLHGTRMWREFHLLDRMWEMGLPVPRPVAARCVRVSPVTCRGELISERIIGARTLAEVIRSRRLSENTWGRVGEAISLFHQHHVYHADLNAHNILLARDGHVFLVDFDKCEIRARLSARSARANLRRLQRSLEKLRDNFPGFHFSSQDWEALQTCYFKRTGFLPLYEAVDSPSLLSIF